MRHLPLSLSLAALLLSPSLAQAGAFVFAGTANGLDLVAHPQNYSGTGGLRPDLTICIDTSVNPALAALAEPSVIKAVETFNRFRSIPSNTYALNANTDIPSGQLDFESTLLHEMGHCQGLAHPNHATESGLAGAAANGTKSTQGPNGVFDQGAGPDGRHGSSDDVRGDDINLHWYIRNQNNPGLLPVLVDGSTMMRPLTDLPAGHSFAANADRDVMNALGFPLTEAVMQQGAFTREAQRHLQHDDVVTLRLARAGNDRTAGNADDYTYRLRYVGQLNNPPNANCNLRVRLDTSTGFAVCSLSGVFSGGDNIRITRAEMAFNSNTNWYFSPGDNTVTTVTSTSPNPGTVGEPYTVSVTVREAPGIAIAGEPRGVVEVSDGVPAPNTATCTINLAGTVNETGTCQLTTTVPGTRDVRAQFLGFAGWDASSGTASHTTEIAATTPTTTSIVSHLPAPTVVGQPYTVSVQVSSDEGTPTGSVTVNDGSANCTIAALAGGAGSCQLVSTSVGTKTLTATYAAQNGFAASSGSATHLVNAAATSTQITGNTPNPSQSGQTVTVSYAVAVTAPGAGTPSGNVTVTVSGGAETCTGSVAAGSCQLALVGLGERTLTATYAGDSNFLGSHGGAAHTVTAAATTTTIQSHVPATTVVGQPYTVSVQVSSAGGTPTGSVTVDDGSANCTIPALAGGGGSCQLVSTTAGNKTLTASYAGAGVFAASSGSTSHLVNAAATTTQITGNAPNPSQSGQTVTVSYAVAVTAPGAGTPSGNVTVTVSGGAETCTASVAAGSCQLALLGTGARTLTATYAGDSNFLGSQGGAAHTVSPATTTTVIESHLPEPSVVGQAFTVSVLVSSAAGTPTGSVTVDDGNANCTIAALAGGSGSCQLVSTTAGNKTLTASYAGEGVFAASSGTTSHVVDAAATTTQITGSAPNPSSPGQPMTVSFAVSVDSPGGGTPGGDVVVTVSDGPETCTGTVAAGSCQLSLAESGERTLFAAFEGSADYLASDASAAHTVAEAGTTTTILSQEPASTVVGQPYLVSVLVESDAGTPSGTVLVSEGKNSCEPLALKEGGGSCELVSDVPGSRTLTATYAGQGIFGGSSDTASHPVDKADSVTVIVAVDPSPSLPGEVLAVEFEVLALPPGAGQPTGTVAVSADSGEDCSATVVEGSCELVLELAGNRSLNAEYGGDSRFNPSSDSVGHTVIGDGDEIFQDGFEAL